MEKIYRKSLLYFCFHAGFGLWSFNNEHVYFHKETHEIPELTNNMFCAELPEGGKDLCQGDRDTGLLGLSAGGLSAYQVTICC